MNEKKTQLNELLESSMSKIREMVDSNTIIGQPIVTADGVTLIPVTRLSFGFGCGGGDYNHTPVFNCFLFEKEVAVCRGVCRQSCCSFGKRNCDVGGTETIPVL